MHFFKSIIRKWLIFILVLVLGIGLFSFTAKALYPDSFWRVVQVAERLSFLYGGVNNPAEYLSLENDGRVALGTIPSNHSAILELASEDKALLVTRVQNVSNIATPENGMILYEQLDACFKVYQGEAWSRCLGVAQGIRVLPQEPQGGNIGEIYYNTTNNTLFIHDGHTWVAVTANFLELTSYHYNCSRHNLTEPNLQLRCPNNKQITSLFYEAATYSPVVDVHSIPEITGVECCETAYHPFYWDATPWSTCNGGHQARSVSCKATGGGAADASACIASHRPAVTQNCQVPVVPSQWQVGEFGACSAGGTQTRTVKCIGPNGQETPGKCSASQRPESTKRCTPPNNGGGGGDNSNNQGPSNNAQCDSTGKFAIPAAEFDSLDGSANAFLRGGNHAYIDWARCDNQVTSASVDNGGIRINFRNPPRNGRVTLTVNTGHARKYRVAHASNISGNLPNRYTSNRTYVYDCNYNNGNYSCSVR